MSGSARRAQDRRWLAGRVAAATLVALGAGVASGIVAPRGPVTTAQCIAGMALVLGVGIAGGVLTRTRWVFLAQLVAYLAGIELARASLEAPSLDLRFDTVYGVLAFVVTRGVHLVLVVLPLAAGVGTGRWFAGREANGDRRRRIPPVGTTILAIATVALVVVVAWPPSTPPVSGPDGASVRGSIAELDTVRLGGTDQTILVRAADPDKPVLLYLSGGPGQSDLALARALSEPWIHDFVFVDLDQRGNGSSYAAIDPLADMTLDRAVDDVIELADQLRARFDEPRIYLMGESWGTILGVLAVQRRPDLFAAWIGSGQMVDVLDTDRRIYADLVSHAARVGDAALTDKLRAIGTPPYRDIPWANSNLLAWYELLYKPYEPSAGYRARGDASGLDPFGVLGSEYSFIDKTNVLRGLVDTFTALYPQLYPLDFRQSVPRLEVPVYVLDGLAELDGRRDVMLEWFDALDAPIKQRVEFEGAAHSVAFEQADAVRELLVNTVVPAAEARPGGVPAGDAAP